jgi:energy-coupling factor transporter ATP-binding protein EcfA2
MRIYQLTIDEFRGIRHLTLNLEGASLVVWGPNGSGKSAVVDALDFLLTGKITRLTGRGTGELRLEDHGPHLGADVASAVVSAHVRFEGVSEAIQISRIVAHPGTLTYPSKYESVVAPALAVAARGHHVLTRREMLRFITAEAGNRADELQRLLNLADLEKVREALVTAEHDAERALAGAKRSQSRAIKDLASEAGMGEIGQQFLAVVNEHRRLLGGQPISAIAKGALVADLAPYSEPTSAVGASAQQVQSSIQAISALVSDSQPVKVAYGALLALFGQAQSSALIAHAIEYARLTELGISLLDG